MSVQITKVFIIVLLIHAAVLSLTWVGFPVPLPRTSADFVFLSSNTDEQMTASAAHVSGVNEPTLKQLSPSTTMSWMRIRQVNKPKL